ncbi:hypothetical protein IC235_18735 [Hymenobacter sp. BT664]|uniref:Uncharacterized protein n=1 Tax=Hymenobacter montanus TaxID=2771359 RepID=A0A927GL88_9BACT|nr:hypothetical protein [Hymenobacter montanus]MBD2769931.1 hypothetical protein [Hymenobacter montanus]
MGTTDNNKPNAASTAKLTKEERLAQAREYAKQFKFETLSAEELKKIRRSAYAYLL